MAKSESDRPAESAGKPAARAGARKREMLTKKSPAMGPSIADAVTVKDGDLFFVCQPDGTVPRHDDHGFGLYYHDTRYMSAYELTLGGERPQLLASASKSGFKAVLQLTNTDLVLDQGAIPKETIGVCWTRLVKGDHQTLYDLFEFHNFGREAIDLPVELHVDADFHDIFVVRGLLALKPGEVRPASVGTNGLELGYEGADGIYRALRVWCSEEPDGHTDGRLRFRVQLAPGERRELLLASTVYEGREAVPESLGSPADVREVERWLAQKAEDWVAQRMQIASNAPLFNRVLAQCFHDLHALRSTLDGEEYFAAGVPWYSTLFGRDSLITAMQTLAYDPQIAEQTLRLLAAYQGRTDDTWRDEGPGKILHELRTGELARLNEVPQTPYYGSVDVTPLFVVTLARHAAWTGSLALFEALRPNVEAALGWIDRSCDAAGYLAYQAGDIHASVNQGWKDSVDAIVNADGTLATPPIALAEVQGYVYLAKTEIAALFERAGEAERARQLRAEAAALRERFNRDYWLEEQGVFALALQAQGVPAAVVSSNAGQALWSGIADPEKVAPVVAHLMADDMFSGWGVRTLSSHEGRYNPIGYHLGTVWPHDNALIAAGCRRYGESAAALRIFHGIFDAATHFELLRLPEVFSGYAREPYGQPVRYPVACHPQAWAAGALPDLVVTLLGLEPDAFNKRLNVVDPMLPQFVDHLTVAGLAVADARVTLRFERKDTHVAVTVAHLHGELEVLFNSAPIT